MNNGKDILRFCRITTGDTEVGDELYQDTMLKLLEKQARLNPLQNIHGRPIDLNFHPYLSMDELSKGFTDTKAKLHGGFITADCHMSYIRDHFLGYAINTGSVGNSLGVTRCHALLIEGDMGETKQTPIAMTTLSIPYDIELAARIADGYDLPNKEAYKTEVRTGVYSR